MVSSPGSELLEFQFLEEETNDQPIPPELDFLPLPLRLPDMEKVWPGYETAGQLIGSEGLKLDKQSSKTIKVDNQVTFGMSVNDSPFIQSHNLPIGFFQHSSTDLDGCGCKLEIGFECGSSGGFGSGSGELAISSTILGADANLACCNDMMDQDDSIAGDQRTETITNANIDDLSSQISSNHSQWDTFVESAAKDDDLDGEMSLLLHS